MAKGKPLTELEVGSIVSSEIKASLGYIGSDITEQRQKSLEYYFGEPFGNEQEGLSSNVKKRCDQVVCIPGAEKIQSLNVAVAAGVILSELVRYRDKKNRML